MTFYKYLGYGVTNSEGVAHLDHDADGEPIDHSYTGVGAGEIDVLASLDNPIVDGSIVSGTFPVLDTLLYDTGTDPSHNIWTGSTNNLTRGSEYSRLEESTIGTPVQINTVMPTGLWVLTMSIKRDGHSTNWDITILNNNVSVFGCATPTNDVWTDIMLVYDGSKIYYFENGSTTPTKTTSVMLDDTKNTVLRLQTPQDITYLDFKDLIVLREGKSAISIGSTTPIIQSGDTATINGSLYESGLIVQNATLDVYKNGTKVDTVNTGSTGVASYSYTGVADGEVEFQFKYGSISSEIYEVLDCIKYDTGIDGTASDIWSNQTTYLSRGTEYSTLTDASSRNIYTTITDNNCIEFDVNIDEYNTSQFIRLMDSDNALLYATKNNMGINNNEWVHVKIEIEDGQASISNNKNANVISGSVTNVNRFLFRCGGDNKSVKFKDFKVYSI